MKIGLTQLKKEIKRQHRRVRVNKQDDYNFLGFVEQVDLTSEVSNLFTIVTPTGATYYNWVSGTPKLKQFIEKVIADIR